MRKVKSPEHDIQAAFVATYTLHLNKYPALRLAFAVPNGQLRDVRVAKKLKAEGQRNAVNDWILPVPSKSYIGLAIEFKAPGKYPTKEQREYHGLLTACFWRVEVHRDPQEAWGAVKEYLESLTSEVKGNIVRALEAS